MNLVYPSFKKNDEFLLRLLSFKYHNQIYQYEGIQPLTTIDRRYHD